MFCTKCGSQVSDGVSFCKVCGNPTDSAASSAVPAPAPATNHTVAYDSSSQTKAPRKAGFGLGVTSIVFGAIALYYSFSDLNEFNTGAYAFIYYSEIGLLFLLSAAGVTLGAIASSKKNVQGRIGLSMGLMALAITLYLARYGA